MLAVFVTCGTRFCMSTGLACLLQLPWTRWFAVIFKCSIFQTFGWFAAIPTVTCRMWSGLLAGSSIAISLVSFYVRLSCLIGHRRVLGLADLMFEAPHAHMEIYSIAGLLRQWPDVLLLIV